MGKIISDAIIAAFIWLMLYFMFRPAQDIMARASERTYHVLEALIVGGFIATIAADWLIRRRLKNKTRQKNRLG